ncbi:hypothetical protein MMC09_000825 [Bachmanniomyces sp. S44760]|nr:hypothetical protein [Bachmanniomyces sp. S44760]
MAPNFLQVIGTDPSKGMVEQARTSTQLSNVGFREATAEEASFLEKESVDMVVSGQAAHWFNYARLFPEMKRILRPGGTLAFWGYKDHVFVDYPRATEILNTYAYGDDESLLGPYWSQPGRSIVQKKYRDIKPPENEWDSIHRVEYEPGTKGSRSGEGTLLLEKKISLKNCMKYIRTWSAYHGWQQKHPEQEKRKDGGMGDIVDEMFDEMRKAEQDWGDEEVWQDIEVNVEWGSGLLLARRK